MGQCRREIDSEEVYAPSCAFTSPEMAPDISDLEDSRLNQRTAAQQKVQHAKMTLKNSNTTLPPILSSPDSHKG